MTDDDLTPLQLALAKKSTVTAFVGRFVSATATGCFVDVGGGRVPAQFGSDYLPEVNEPVNVLFINGAPFMMGPVGAKPGKGTVQSVSASVVTLDTAYGEVVCPYNQGVTPSTGQVMRIGWREGPFAEAVMSTSPKPADPPPAPGGGATTHADVFTALDAGSFNGRWWTAQVRADDSDLGCWFYGSKISDTIPAGARIQAVQVYVSADRIYGNPPIFGVHPYQSNPGGAPTLGALSPIPVAPGWATLPTGFGDVLKAGGGSAGVGVAHGGFNIFRSLAQDGQSGALRITSVY
ncbi:hypothetical protein [Curtobacterium sp. MCBA15_012]|uniref:hypothetical protein n=1 Tax=Curtobacterium sp. MCBA15_012 TaxID=1898738 RepID=UPI0008DD9CA8|nr:hypothetical protein [Curtobacterium sp. MCBA15_012]WIA99752.1 hypothetical protein QOL15_14755 [Curtobacterium sp. MCBA15_012]